MHYKFKQGFTLVEILVVISIVTVLGSVVIFSYGNFNDRLALSSAAQEVALAIRQAQTYGINVKETTMGGGDFTKAFGVYFTQTSGQNKAYYLFADKNSDKKYSSATGSCGGECVELDDLRDGVYISSIGGSCPPANGSTALHITFLRPNPDAVISFTNGLGLTCTDQSNGIITLMSARGSTAIITVYKTGQIEVK